MASTFGTEPASGGRISGQAIGAAACAVLLVLAVVALATLRRAPVNSGAALSADAYANRFEIGDVSLSEATNGGGGKVTYVDGTVHNTGGQTVSAATVQVTFASEDGSAPQRQTMPLMLIRTRVPYVDLEPVSAEPLKPGDRREFRLIFETVPVAWDTKPPEIRLIAGTIR